jgi:hypothetical protein
MLKFNTKIFNVRSITEHNHCRQRAPTENVWSTSAIFKAVFFKADTDSYREYLLIYCVYNVLNYDAL